MEPDRSSPTSTVQSASTPAGAGLDAVRLRRAELRESLNALEFTLAAPAWGRSVVWGEAVHDSLATVAGDFAAHVEITEGPGGLHETILARDVRLANQVAALTAEHAQVADLIAVAVAASEAPVGEADVDELRDRGTRLLGVLVKHRQTGADLIYEAFHADVGGAD